MIKKTTRVVAAGAPVTRNPVNRTPVTANAQRRKPVQNVTPGQKILASLSPEKQAFARQLRANMRKTGTSIMAATNTTNIMVRPDFLELLPLFVQNLLVLDVFGSVAMKSRQQLIPYFKFVAENTKGQTHAGQVLSSPFVNRQGIDHNFTGRTIKNEVIAEGTEINGTGGLMYTPVLPGTVTLNLVVGGKLTQYVDDEQGNLVTKDGATAGYIDYSNGTISLDDAVGEEAADSLKATYQYDNENVGPDENGRYGAKMAKGYLQLDEINLVAEAQEIACYWSIYSAFAAQTEWGANIGDMAKEAAFSELTAEINEKAFNKLRRAATFKPQFNWDASPVLTNAVVPSDYLNMFKLKLNQAAASIYQSTRLSRPNRLVVGSNVATYLSMIEGFNAESVQETVGPYRLGQLNEFMVIVDPNYNPDEWVMCCKNNDIRRNSALFGEYMPLTTTDAIGLADMSKQQGAATMTAMEIVNPDTVVGGKILGVY